MHYQRAHAKFKSSLIHIDPMGSIFPLLYICRYKYTDSHLDGQTHFFFNSAMSLFKQKKGEGQTWPMTVTSHSQENETQVSGDGNTNNLQVEVGFALCALDGDVFEFRWAHVSLLKNVKVGGKNALKR